MVSRWPVKSVGKVLLLAAFALGAPCWIAAAEPAPLLGTNELTHLHRALSRLNMDESDLGFEKDVAKPGLALEWVRHTLTHPLELPPVADRIRAAASSNSARELWALAGDLLESVPATRPAPGNDESLACSNAVNPQLAGYLREFVDRAGDAADLFAGALRGLETNELDYAAAAFLGDLFDAEDRPETRAALRAAGVSSRTADQVLEDGRALDPEPSQKRLIDIARRLKLDQALAAGGLFHEAVARLARQVQEVKDWPGKPVALTTRLGAVIVGTPGADVYTNGALLILDPGGDDRYAGDAAVANGLKGQRLAAVLDLAGNDRYDGAGLLGQGSALFGLAVLLDLSGDDRYEAAYSGQGAALFGAAWLEDGAGSDFYKARGFAQAAGIAGLGVLRDLDGCDIYTVGLAGQAYAGVRGAGFLVDEAGDDRYLAGNVEPDWERFEDRFVSLAQGFAIGLRPFAGGGVAALVDLKGNDTYVADVYGQGVSYWYSAGFLLDAAGNDTYRVYQYGQGTGIHLSLGLLADDGGNDVYSGFALVQGSAHDYAVGMLFARAGNDVYTAESSAQGRAINNSFALLVDGAGNDAYFGARPEECQGIGHDGGPRQYGSLSILMDLGGTDSYSCGATNNGMLARPSFGIVYDVETAPEAGKESKK